MMYTIRDIDKMLKELKLILKNLYEFTRPLWR